MKNLQTPVNSLCISVGDLQMCRTYWLLVRPKMKNHLFSLMSFQTHDVLSAVKQNEML